MILYFAAALILILVWRSSQDDAQEPFVSGLARLAQFPGKFLKGTVGVGGKAAGTLASRAVKPGQSAAKKAAPGVGATSRWQKADTLLTGASLATLPLFFIPFGGGGEDDGAGMDDASAEQAATVSSSSVVSSVSSFFMMMMMMMMMSMNANE
jgi:hypothetical protein